ncbi:MAG: hypothetical protein GY729_21870 [Desulfobacteraceae bacterium]|nr:hypothetical protein [Desulfobacteraceae bacterium]
MSIKKIIAIGVIYIIGWAGWWTLGTVTSFRSSGFTHLLETRVQSLWGDNLVQEAPAFYTKIPGTEDVRWLMPVKNDISVEIDPEYKKKGLIWYSTFRSFFKGIYTIANEEEVVQKIYIHFDFPAKGATYDAFAIHLDDRLLGTSVNTNTGIDEMIELAPGQSVTFKVQYQARGMDTWRYQMAKKTGRVQNFNLSAKTGFKKIDYTPNSLSPMSQEELNDGLNLNWTASDLITNSHIGIIVPEKLNPGPLTTRITYFAPVCLLFFFILVTAIGIMKKINIHPMHYLFVAAGFFAFHLLLSYMAGHIWIHTAFIISAGISVMLVTLYLCAALGKEFPWKIAVCGQLFFLVLFSYSFFIEGITGIIVATGSVVTLAILMKLTAHVDWDDVFASIKTPIRNKKTIPACPPEIH